jgi:hypothetical protein
MLSKGIYNLELILIGGSFTHDIPLRLNGLNLKMDGRFVIYG